MSNLITHSLTYSRESLVDYFVKPLFIQNDIRDIISVRTNIKGSEKLDFIDKLTKIAKAYAQGTSFSASTGITVTRKTLTVAEMKAEVKQKEVILKHLSLGKRVNILVTATKKTTLSEHHFERIVSELFMNALKADLQRQIFFGDTDGKQLLVLIYQQQPPIRTTTFITDFGQG